MKRPKALFCLLGPSFKSVQTNARKGFASKLRMKKGNRSRKPKKTATFQVAACCAFLCCYACNEDSSRCSRMSFLVHSVASAVRVLPLFHGSHYNKEQ